MHTEFEERAVKKLMEIIPQFDKSALSFKECPLGEYVYYKPNYPDNSPEDVTVYMDQWGFVNFYKYLISHKPIMRMYANMDEFEKRETYFDKEELVDRVSELFERTPDGFIVDADTVLADIVEECNYQVTGLSIEILDIWKKAKDKLSVEALFHTLTGVEFELYLRMCLQKTTKERSYTES